MHVRRLTLPTIATLKRIDIDDSKSQHTKKVNQYILLNKIGHGANCKVVLGLDVASNIYYAIKIFHSDLKHSSPSRVQPLEREVRIMRMIHHENIVQLHEVLHAPQRDTSYLVMEFGNCGSLKRIIDSKIINIPLKTIATILKHVVNGLSYLHGQGFVHQDIKPSNILIFSEGIAKIGDFGIGHSFQSAQTVVGSPAYQAPEVFDDDPDESGEVKDLDPSKEDVWSLGVTLFEVVFKQLPFQGENVYEIMHCIKQDGVKLPHDIDEDLKNLILGMLTIDPEQRLSIRQIENHPFLKLAEDRFVFPLQPLETKKPDQKLPILQITANVCDSSYTFNTMHSSSSWSGSLPHKNSPRP